MVPVHQYSSGTHDSRKMHHGILDADAAMRTGAKDKVVARSLVRGALRVQPALGKELGGLGVDLGIMERGVERRDDHGASRNGVVIGDGERLQGLVGNLRLKQVLELSKVRAN